MQRAAGNNVLNSHFRDIVYGIFQVFFSFPTVAYNSRIRQILALAAICNVTVYVGMIALLQKELWVFLVKICSGLYWIFVLPSLLVSPCLSSGVGPPLAEPLQSSVLRPFPSAKSHCVDRNLTSIMLPTDGNIHTRYTLDTEWKS